MTYVTAIIFICYASGGCNQVTAQVEPKACSAPTYHVKVAQDGQWVSATSGIRCGRKAQ